MGTDDGLALGALDGDADGSKEGVAVGLVEGDELGVLDGEALGVLDGDADGINEGIAVGSTEGDELGQKCKNVSKVSPSFSQMHVVRSALACSCPHDMHRPMPLPSLILKVSCGHKTQESVSR